MPEPREARTIIENAEQAAAAGDYASAEQLLREAVALQEQTLGPHHQDLANTLNNLGIVCEKTDNPIDAEHYFRRAYTIATATLPADHPFVATSRKNLHDFCAARGRPAELPPSPPAVAAWLEAPAPAASPRTPVEAHLKGESSGVVGANLKGESSRAVEADLQRESSGVVEADLKRESSGVVEADLKVGPYRISESPKTQDVTPIARERSLRPLVLGALSVVALLIVILTVVRPWRSTVEETKSPPATAIAPARQTPAPAPTAPPAEPVVRPQDIAKPPQPTRGGDDATAARPSTPERPAAMPTVVTAQLCTALRAWRCEAADSQVPPGPMFFYTQVKSATATTIEHRWYQGDRMRRAVQLRIEANPGAGYRTYSRTTIGRELAGDWRVELRSADGTVLHEERFTVREKR